jgi:hypothetical protein
VLEFITDNYQVVLALLGGFIVTLVLLTRSVVITKFSQEKPSTRSRVYRD